MSETELPVYRPGKNRGFLSILAGVFFTLAAGAGFVAWVGSPFSGFGPILVSGLFLAFGTLCLLGETTVKDTQVPPTLPRESMIKPQQWFWVTLGLMAIAIAFTGLIESNYFAGIGSAVAIVIGVILLHVLAKLDLLALVRERWRKILLLTFVYLAIGIGYSFFRYDIYVGDWRKGYEEAYAQHMLDTKNVAEESQRKWDASSYRPQRPSFSDDSGMIGRWFVFWPWSLTYFVLSDFMARALEWIVDQFSGVYDWIVERNLRDLKE